MEPVLRNTFQNIMLPRNLKKKKKTLKITLVEKTFQGTILDKILINKAMLGRLENML